MKVIYTSPWIPPEWIAAHGHEPCGVWTIIDIGTVNAPEGMCPVARAIAELVMQNYQAAFIFGTTCDQIKRAADLVQYRCRSPVYVFNLPASWQTNAARRLYHAELLRLGKFLEQVGGTRPSPAELRAVIAHYNNRRTHVLNALQQSNGKWAAATIQAYFCQDFTKTDCLPQRLAGETVRLGIVGGPMLQTQWQFFDIVEAIGSAIALNATEVGELSIVPVVPNCGENHDFATLLGNHYFDNCVSVFRRPNTQLYHWLRTQIAQRNIRALLVWAYLHCDLWRAETETLREQFGLPVLMIEPQDVISNPNRISSRLIALVEAVKRQNSTCIPVLPRPQPKVIQTN